MLALIWQLTLWTITRCFVRNLAMVFCFGRVCMQRAYSSASGTTSADRIFPTLRSIFSMIGATLGCSACHSHTQYHRSPSWSNATYDSHGTSHTSMPLGIRLSFIVYLIRPAMRVQLLHRSCLLNYQCTERKAAKRWQSDTARATPVPMIFLSTDGLYICL